MLCVLDLLTCVGWVIDPSMARWLALPGKLHRKLTGGDKDNALSFSIPRWWRWRKASLLPT